MSIISAKATFRPGNVKSVLDLYVQVRLFAKVQTSQQIVLDEAQRLVPVASGELAGSLRTTEISNENQKLTGRVVADAPHAAFVEFGTGLVGAGTYPYDLPTEGVPFTGSWVYDYKRQNWQGMEAQPYLRPGLESAREKILEEFQS